MAQDASIEDFNSEVCKLDNFRKIGFLSRWGKFILKSIYKFLDEENLFSVSNGYEPEYYKEKLHKENAMVWSSRHERGLGFIIKYILPEILKEVPDFKIYVSSYENDVPAEYRGNDSIIYLGSLSKGELARKQKQCKIWIYPNVGYYDDLRTGFFETFCITAIENGVAENAILTTNEGGLGTTLDGYNHFVNADYLRNENLDYGNLEELGHIYAKEAIRLLKDEKLRTTYAQNACEVSEKFTWENATLRWINEFEGKKNIALTTVSNNVYTKYTEVAIQSFVETNKWFDGYIYVINGNTPENTLSPRNKTRLKKIYKRLYFIEADESKYKKTREHFQLNYFNCSFLKYEALNLNYDKVIQVDGDVLFWGSVEETTQNNYPIQWVPNYEEGQAFEELPPNNRFIERDYCNTGVIIIDKEILKKRYRDDLIKLSETLDFNIIDWYSPGVKWADQDVFNIFFKDTKSFILPFEYNMPRRIFKNGFKKELLDNVKILHYYGENKPLDNVEKFRDIDKLWIDYFNKMNDIKIIGVTLTFNEAERVPYVMPYYERLGVDKLVVYDNGSTDNTIKLLEKYPFVEIRHYETDGEMNNNEFLRIKNNAWKEFADDYDWAIVCDFDEVIYCKGDLKNILRETNGTVFQKTMMDLYSEKFIDCDTLLHEKISYGSPWIYGIDFYADYIAGNKNILFKLDSIEEMNYGFGGHTANPQGNNVSFFTDDRLFTFHLKYLDKEYILKKSQENYERQISKGGKGTSRPEYLKDRTNLDYTYFLMEKTKFNIEDYNRYLINGLYYPLELVIVTNFDNIQELRQPAYSIREKLLYKPDIHLTWILKKNNAEIPNNEIFKAIGPLKWSTLIYENDFDVEDYKMEHTKPFWLYKLPTDTIVNANLPYILRKMLGSTEGKKAVSLNFMKKDGSIHHRKISDYNMLYHSTAYNQGLLEITTDDIIFEDDFVDQNKASAFVEMVRTPDDFSWDFGRLKTGEVTLTVQSEWERIPLVYSIPQDAKKEIFTILEEAYKRNNLL